MLARTLVSLFRFGFQILYRILGIIRTALKWIRTSESSEPATLTTEALLNVSVFDQSTTTTDVSNAYKLIQCVMCEFLPMVGVEYVDILQPQVLEIANWNTSGTLTTTLTYYYYNPTLHITEGECMSCLKTILVIFMLWDCSIPCRIPQSWQMDVVSSNSICLHILQKLQLSTHIVEIVVHSSTMRIPIYDHIIRTHWLAKILFNTSLRLCSWHP